MFEPLPIETKKADISDGFTPMPIQSQKVDIGGEFTPIPIRQEETERSKPSPITLPFEARHPTLYGIYGAGKETGKALIPYIKYIDPEERKRFMKLSQQKQTRELLLQNLDTVLLLGAAPITKGTGKILEKYLPKTYKFLTSPLKKEIPTVAQRIAKYKKKHGEMPSKKMIQDWWRNVSKFKADTITPEKDIVKTKGTKTVSQVLDVEPQTPVTQKVISEGILKAEGPLPKYAGSVNLEKQAISTDLKHLELQASEQIPKRVQTWDQTGKLSTEIAQDYNKTAKVLTKAKKGEALTAVEIDTARQVNINAVNKLKELSETLSPDDLAKAFQQYTDDVFKVTSQASSEAGRALNIHKKEISVNRMTKAISELGRGLNKREFAEFKSLNLENPLEVKRFMERLGDPKLRDYIYEFWYNSILSGIPTHVVNAASNTAWIAFQVPHRALTATVDSMITRFTGQARTRYLNEIIPMMVGYKTGAKRGIKAAADIIRKGKVTGFETKWAQEVGSALGAFERSPNKVVRGIGKAITLPTKALRAMDVWGNSIAYDSHIRSLARRAANTQGLKGVTRDNFEKMFMKNLPEKAHEEAMKYAKYNTFMDDPGWFSSAIIRLRGKIPGGRFIVPFVNTRGNLLKRGVEMTPGLGLSLVKGKNPSEIIAKQIEGAIIGLYVLNKCDIGEITGSSPKSKAEREAFYRQGKKAWSIRVGNTWYQYRRIEPFNTVIASVVITYDKIKNAKDEDTATEIFFDMVHDLKNNLIDSAYLQGVSRILDRYGRAKGMVQRTTSSLIPYSGFFRSVNRAYEAGTIGSAKIRDTSTWLGAFSQIIPGLSEGIPPKLNVWGEDIVLEGGVLRQWLPYKWSTEKDDPVENVLKKLDVYPGLPRQTVTINNEKTNLDDDIYRDYCIAYGHKAKADLSKMITKKLWQRALKDEKKYPILIQQIDSHLKMIGASFRRRAITEQRKRMRTP